MNLKLLKALTACNLYLLYRILTFKPVWLVNTFEFTDGSKIVAALPPGAGLNQIVLKKQGKIFYSSRNEVK